MTFPSKEKEITLEIPGDAASGSYTLLQKAKETHTGKEVVHYAGHQVTGVSVTLNTYTLKEKYFDNEPVSGKAEITSGSGAVENGRLQAGIVRFMESQGIEEQKSRDFMPYNTIYGGTGCGHLLYLVTG